MTVGLGIVLTSITGLVLAYLAFIHQQSLKAFELLYSRRNEVLKDIESAFNKVFDARTKTGQYLQDYMNRYYQDGLILYHKVNGSEFGKTTAALAMEYMSLIGDNPRPDYRGHHMSSQEDWDAVRGWLLRTQSALAVMYGAAHADMSREIMSFVKPYDALTKQLDLAYQPSSDQGYGQRTPSETLPRPTH